MPEIGRFTFNQFLIDADEPLLFHTGPRGMFPLVSEAMARMRPVEDLRWITFGHFESDECGSMNEWLDAAPDADVAHGAIGVMVRSTTCATGRPSPRRRRGARPRWQAGAAPRHAARPPRVGRRALYEETTGRFLR